MSAETEWATLRTALPVTVMVGHRQHSRPYGDFQHGGEHIVVQESIQFGRFKRDAFTALCETKSNHMGSYLERHPEELLGGREQPFPSCQTCLKHARRLTASEWRPCASCLGVCDWVETHWVCRDCGDEWEADHDPKYAAPGDAASQGPES